MTQTIDVTGLPGEAIRVVESIVGLLREQNREPAPTPCSIFDLIGNAGAPRTGEDIARQVREEHDAWGEP